MTNVTHECKWPRVRQEVILACLYSYKNSVAHNPQANYMTERPPLVGEVSANFSGQRVSRGQRNGTPRPLISVF
jgi:hypothetical protein